MFWFLFFQTFLFILNLVACVYSWFCTQVLILNVELELKSERQNAEIRISDPKQYQSIVDAEWKIICKKQ